MGDVEIPALVKQIVRGLRGSAFLATVLATSFMAASHEKAIFPFDYKADYTDLMLFKFEHCCEPLQLLLCMPSSEELALAIGHSFRCAAMAAAYLHKNGDSQALWPPICSQVPTYCYRVILAISIGLGGVFMFLLIIIFSISAILNPLILV
ncbi:NITRATE FORMATE IRON DEHYDROGENASE [Salix koriyanagi]|uniref:CASP-like protein n=1 Tax=Salix koriyanagi TaxID=2511006 RepID=A0A9Q0VQH4_9ROSI|nr:NITRATE FORMATE IRON DEHYDROGENASE [Salix koriyanagi]